MYGASAITKLFQVNDGNEKKLELFWVFRFLEYKYY